MAERQFAWDVGIGRTDWMVPPAPVPSALPAHAGHARTPDSAGSVATTDEPILPRPLSVERAEHDGNSSASVQPAHLRSRPQSAVLTRAQAALQTEMDPLNAALYVHRASPTSRQASASVRDRLFAQSLMSDTGREASASAAWDHPMNVFSAWETDGVPPTAATHAAKEYEDMWGDAERGESSPAAVLEDDPLGLRLQFSPAKHRQSYTLHKNAPVLLPHESLALDTNIDALRRVLIAAERETASAADDAIANIRRVSAHERPRSASHSVAGVSNTSLGPTIRPASVHLDLSKSLPCIASPAGRGAEAVSGWEMWNSERQPSADQRAASAKPWESAHASTIPPIPTTNITFSSEAQDAAAFARSAAIVEAEAASIREAALRGLKAKLGPPRTGSALSRPTSAATPSTGRVGSSQRARAPQRAAAATGCSPNPSIPTATGVHGPTSQAAMRAPAGSSINRASTAGGAAIIQSATPDGHAPSLHAAQRAPSRSVGNQSRGGTGIPTRRPLPTKVPPPVDAPTVRTSSAAQLSPTAAAAAAAIAELQPLLGMRIDAATSGNGQQASGVPVATTPRGLAPLHGGAPPCSPRPATSCMEDLMHTLPLALDDARRLSRLSLARVQPDANLQPDASLHVHRAASSAGDKLEGAGGRREGDGAPASQMRVQHGMHSDTSPSRHEHGGASPHRSRALHERAPPSKRVPVDIYGRSTSGPKRLDVSVEDTMERILRDHRARMPQSLQALQQRLLDKYASETGLLQQLEQHEGLSESGVGTDHAVAGSIAAEEEAAAVAAAAHQQALADADELLADMDAASDACADALHAPGVHTAAQRMSTARLQAAAAKAEAAAARASVKLHQRSAPGVRPSSAAPRHAPFSVGDDTGRLPRASMNVDVALASHSAMSAAGSVPALATRPRSRPRTAVSTRSDEAHGIECAEDQFRAAALQVKVPDAPTSPHGSRRSLTRLLSLKSAAPASASSVLQSPRGSSSSDVAQGRTNSLTLGASSRVILLPSTHLEVSPSPVTFAPSFSPPLLATEVASIMASGGRGDAAGSGMDGRNVGLASTGPHAASIDSLATSTGDATYLSTGTSMQALTGIPPTAIARNAAASSAAPSFSVQGRPAASVAPEAHGSAAGVRSAPPHTPRPPQAPTPPAYSISDRAPSGSFASWSTLSVVGSGGRHVALPPTSQGQAQSRLITTPRDSSGVLTRPSTVHLSTSRSPASLPSSPGRVAAGGRAASSRPAHSASLSALRHEASLTELSADMMVDFDFHAEHAAAGGTMVGAAFTGWQGAAHSASASVYDDGTSSPPAVSRLPPLRSAHE